MTKSEIVTTAIHKCLLNMDIHQRAKVLVDEKKVFEVRQLWNADTELMTKEDFNQYKASNDFESYIAYEIYNHNRKDCILVFILRDV